ncbi:MAG: hypothetical protein ACYS5V_17745, partial [Planctomycetota bacterium]
YEWKTVEGIGPWAICWLEAHQFSCTKGWNIETNEGAWAITALTGDGHFLEIYSAGEGAAELSNVNEIRRLYPAVS